MIVCMFKLSPLLCVLGAVFGVARARCVSLRALSHLDSLCGGAFWLTSGSLYSNCNAVVVVVALTACISDDSSLLRSQTMSRLGAGAEHDSHTLLVDVRVHKVTRDLVASWSCP